MIQKIKRPVSILLVLMMVVGMFTILPITASAGSPSDSGAGSPGTGTNVTPTTGYYYVVGTMNDWAIDESYKMSVNPSNTSEYMLTGLELEPNDQFKVVYSADGTTKTTYYPDGTDNNYGQDDTTKVTAYMSCDVYCRPDGNSGDDWFYHVILVNNFHTQVAQVGDDKFETFAEALAAAADKGSAATVTVLADCTLDSQVNLPATADVTVDFKGNTVTVSYHKAIVNAGALTLCDTSADADGGMAGTGKGGLVDNTGSLTINSGVYTSENINGTKNNTCAFYVHNTGATAVVNGGTVDTVGYPFYVYTNATVTVNDGIINSKKQSAISGNGNSGNGGYVINVKGGTISSEENAAIYHPNNGTLNITGGTITGPTAIYIKSGATTVGSTEIGGSATITGTGAKADYTYTGDGCNPTGDAIVIENCGYPGGAPEIGISGGTIISEHADAVASYAHGTNATTGDDYEPITGFVSGGTFSNEVPEEYCKNGFSPVDNGGGTYGVTKTLAVEAYDSNNELVGTYTSINDAIEAAGNGGKVKLVADLYEQQTNYTQVTPMTLDLNGHMINVDGGAGLNFGTAYYWNGDHVFTITDSSDPSTGGISITPKYTGNACISDANGWTIIIEGGTYTSTGKAIYCTGSNGSITVNGGTFNGDIYVHDSGYGHGTLSITGGTVNGTLSTVDNAVLTVSGGTFDEPVPAEYCAEGYDPVDNSDGTYTVAPHEHDWDYENVSWNFTENASHTIYAKYTLTCKTDPTHTKEQTGSGTSMSTVAVSGDKFVYSHAAVKIDGISVAVPNYTRNIADGIINQYELKAAVKVAGNYKLANDITGFYDNVKPVDGFVLDGQDHMIKYGTMNASGRVMFVAADQNTKFTLKNITLDGNNKAKWAVCAYTGNSGNNAGNVITLDTVTIQNFKSTDYVGAINAFGSSTWNLKDCTITGNTTVDDSDGLSGSAVWAGSKATINIDGGTYDEVYLHSYSGTGAVLNADGGATIDNLVLDLTKTDTLKANIDEATVGAITANDGFIPEEAVVMDPDKATVAAPEGYKWVDSEETGMKTLAPKEYVAQIEGGAKYESLAEALEAAENGDTITLLADITITDAIDNTKTVTIDFADKTLSFGNWKFENHGNLTLTGTTGGISCGKGCVDNYGTLTINGGVYTSSVGGSGASFWNNPNVDATMTINGGTITGSNIGVMNEGGTLEVNEGAAISGPYGIITNAQGTTTVLGGTVTGTGDDGVAASVFGASILDLQGGTLSAEYGVVITENNTNLFVRGATINATAFAISSNGNAGNEGYYIYVWSGNVISTGDAAIYHQNNGTLYVSGGIITGQTGIYIKSGTTTITGGTITGNGEAKDYDFYGNGVNSTGDAIVVDNCNYPGGPSSVELKGNPTIVSENAKQIGDYTGNGETELAPVTSKSNTLTLPEGLQWVETATPGVYEVAEVEDLFPGYSVSVGGTITMNVYINTEAIPGFDQASNASVTFTWDSELAEYGNHYGDDTYTVDLIGLPVDDNGYVRASVPVNAAQMANTITAKVTVDGTDLNETGSFSVKEYGETILADTTQTTNVKTLVKAMLNYGAMAQKVFETQLVGEERPTIYANAGEGVAYTTELNAVTSGAIRQAIKDANEGQTGATIEQLQQIGEDTVGEWRTTSVIFLDGNTIRHYFDDVTESGTDYSDDAKKLQGTDYIWYVEEKDIAANHLDTLYDFSIDGQNFKYSVLNYAADVLDSGMDTDVKNLVKAMYLYNQAANACIG